MFNLEHQSKSSNTSKMLTERFVASTINPEKSDSASTLGVHVHDFQPIPKLISTYKKSSCNINCLAVNSTHIFAAQADKAVIHVYSREKGNQESTVPFPEKICCIALAGEQDGAGVLILGTDSGRIILWEVRHSQNHARRGTDQTK